MIWVGVTHEHPENVDVSWGENSVAGGFQGEPRRVRASACAALPPSGGAARSTSAPPPRLARCGPLHPSPAASPAPQSPPPAEHPIPHLTSFLRPTRTPRARCGLGGRRSPTGQRAPGGKSGQRPAAGPCGVRRWRRGPGLQGRTTPSGPSAPAGEARKGCPRPPGTRGR